MARKRQVDPIYPFEKEIAALSISARYFYILCWCQMDDTNGVLPYDVFMLKSQIFPGDNVDVEPLIAELVAESRLKIFESDGKKWLWCPNLLKHQTINHPSKRKYPDPPKELREYSRSSKVALTQSGVSRGEVNELSRVESKHETKSDCQILTFMTGLDLTGPQQTEILLAWKPGLKIRTRCYDCAKCHKDFLEIVRKVKAQSPKKFGAYFVKAVNNFILGE